MFSPPGKKAGWRHTRTPVTVLIQGAANHRGMDALAAAGEPQVLVGKFAYGPLDKDLEDEEVEVFIQEDPPCGAWGSLGTALTTTDSGTGSAEGVENDGGRVFFQVPDDRRRKVGRHPVRMLVQGDHSLAAMDLYVVKPDTAAVVFDIDGTLTTDDFQVVREFFEGIARRTYVPRLMAGSPAVARAWADAGYLPVYLTGRPDVLTRASRDWLRAHAFPPGPVHCAADPQEALPTLSGVGRYKIAFLQSSSRKGLAFAAAYGNASTDIAAYEAAGIDKTRTYIVGRNKGKEGTVAVESYRTHLVELGAPPAPKIAFRTWGEW